MSWTLRGLIIISFGLLLCCPSESVTEVNRTELQTLVNDSKETVVYFYAKWCQLCEAFDSVFDSVATEYSRPGDLQFVKFDGGSDRGFAAPLIDDSFPGVALLHGSKLVDHMRAIKTRGNFERWIEQMTGDAIEVFDTREEAEKRSKRFAVTFIASVPSISSDIYNIISTVAQSHRQWAKWLVVIDPSVTQGISVKHPYEKVKSLDGFSTIDELKQWGEEHRFPLFGPMDASNQHSYYESGRNPAVFVGTDKEFKEHGITFRKLAVAFRKEFSFVWFKSNQEGAHSTLSSMMVRSTPSLVAFTGTGNKREHKRFVYSGKKTELNDFDKITQFLNDVQAKKVRPTVRSLPMPSESEFSGKRVKSVPASNFEDLVLHESKDFMLVLTAPKGNEVFQGCLKCEPLVQMLEQMAPMIDAEIGSSIVEFGEFLVTDNEMPMFDWGGTWEFEELPVIYLVKAGTKTPIEYKGDMNSTSILKFWEDHTEQIKVKQRLLSQSLDFNQTSTKSASMEPREEL